MEKVETIDRREGKVETIDRREGKVENIDIVEKGRLKL